MCSDVLLLHRRGRGTGRKATSNKSRENLEVRRCIIVCEIKSVFDSFSVKKLNVK